MSLYLIVSVYCIALYCIQQFSYFCCKHVNKRSVQFSLPVIRYLQAANDTDIEITEEVTLPLMLNDRCIMTHALVSPDVGEVMLGANWLYDIGASGTLRIERSLSMGAQLSQCLNGAPFAVGEWFSKMMRYFRPGKRLMLQHVHPSWHRTL